MRRACGLLAAGVIATAIASPAAASSTERGRWLLDELGAAGTAVDSSGLGNHGVNHDVLGNGTGYVFNGISSRVVVPDSSSLDPGADDFSFGVTMVMTTPPAKGETYDVLRKGLSSTKGGDYKVEIKHVKGTARARCVVKDTNRVIAAIVAPTSLANGVPHTVVCSKTSRGVSIKIDSLAPRTKAVAALGSVSNSSQLALGAKAETQASTGFDWYQGLLNDAWVNVG